MTSTVVTSLVSVNAIALVMLVGEGISEYLSTKERIADSTANASRIRLQLLRLVTWILAVIGTFKTVLPNDLADSIISAWFVGQGFALQRSLQSLVAGIVLRYDSIVRQVVVDGEGTVQIKEVMYTVASCSMVSVTLVEQHDAPTMKDIPRGRYTLVDQQDVPASKGLHRARYTVIEWESLYHATLVPP